MSEENRKCHEEFTQRINQPRTEKISFSDVKKILKTAESAQLGDAGDTKEVNISEVSEENIAGETTQITGQSAPEPTATPTSLSFRKVGGNRGLEQFNASYSEDTEETRNPLSTIGNQHPDAPFNEWTSGTISTYWTTPDANYINSTDNITAWSNYVVATETASDAPNIVFIDILERERINAFKLSSIPTIGHTINSIKEIPESDAVAVYAQDDDGNHHVVITDKSGQEQQVELNNASGDILETSASAIITDNGSNGYNKITISNLTVSESTGIASGGVNDLATTDAETVYVANGGDLTREVYAHSQETNSIEWTYQNPESLEYIQELEMWEETGEVVATDDLNSIHILEPFSGNLRKAFSNSDAIQSEADDHVDAEPVGNLNGNVSGNTAIYQADEANNAPAEVVDLTAETVEEFVVYELPDNEGIGVALGDFTSRINSDEEIIAYDTADAFAPKFAWSIGVFNGTPIIQADNQSDQLAQITRVSVDGNVSTRTVDVPPRATILYAIKGKSGTLTVDSLVGEIQPDESTVSDNNNNYTALLKLGDTLVGQAQKALSEGIDFAEDFGDTVEDLGILPDDSLNVELQSEENNVALDLTSQLSTSKQEE